MLEGLVEAGVVLIVLAHVVAIVVAEADLLGGRVVVAAEVAAAVVDDLDVDDDAVVEPPVVTVSVVTAGLVDFAGVVGVVAPLVGPEVTALVFGVDMVDDGRVEIEPRGPATVLALAVAFVDEGVPVVDGGAADVDPALVVGVGGELGAEVGV